MLFIELLITLMLWTYTIHNWFVRDAIEIIANIVINDETVNYIAYILEEICIRLKNADIEQVVESLPRLKKHIAWNHVYLTSYLPNVAAIFHTPKFIIFHYLPIVIEQHIAVVAEFGEPIQDLQKYLHTSIEQLAINGTMSVESLKGIFNHINIPPPDDNTLKGWLQMFGFPIR